MVQLIDGARTIMQQAGVEDDTVENILTMLRQSQVKVRRGERIERTPTASYGNAATAVELGSHAGKAHDHVVEAMRQMVEGLTRYTENVEVFREDVHETDDVVSTDFTRRTSTVVDFAPGLDCLSPETFADNPTCEVPTENGQ